MERNGTWEQIWIPSESTDLWDKCWLNKLLWRYGQDIDLNQLGWDFGVKCIYVCCGPRRFPYHMIVMSFDNNTSGVASRNRNRYPLCFVPFLCAIVSSTLLRLTTSDNLFGTVKLFVDCPSKIDLWAEMWITSNRIVICGEMNGPIGRHVIIINMEKRTWLTGSKYSALKLTTNRQSYRDVVFVGHYNDYWA